MHYAYDANHFCKPYALTLFKSSEALFFTGLDMFGVVYVAYIVEGPMISAAGDLLLAVVGGPPAVVLHLEVNHIYEAVRSVELFFVSRQSLN